ncbi:hypothetical protein B0H63DRAFT_460534 [Podospora didyma]|uniref:Uncharacterized protein n=1 Tax=Podospora didyma TaxID=330526 RepID=A0AAE0U8B6_9PEZI|nr:hypothetical protein B0H63DRAFT_460534 [Podospora didyma]
MIPLYFRLYRILLNISLGPFFSVLPFPPTAQAPELSFSSSISRCFIECQLGVSRRLHSQKKIFGEQCRIARLAEFFSGILLRIVDRGFCFAM